MRKYFGLTLAATGLAALPTIGMAVPSLSDVLGASGISAQGFLSGGYTFGFNKGQTLAYHTFDTDANTFALNQADLTISSLPSSGFGALVEVLAGNDARDVNKSLDSGSAQFALPQAYLQYATGNLTIIGGRYWTLAGAEVAADSKNTNISRSYLYTLAEPFAHTGVRATYKFNDQLTGIVGFANTATTGLISDTNKPKTAEANLTFTPNSTTTLALTDYYGVDGGNGTTEVRHNYLDGVASFNVTPALQFVANVDWARFIPVDGAAPAAGIYGAAGYLNYTFCDRLKGSLRGEYLKSSGGYITAYDKTDGKAQLSEVTATLGYVAAKNFDVLGEVRYDMGDKIYPNPGSDTVTGSDFSSHQGELEVKAVYKFGTT
jgi:hypothetical protein